MRVFTVSLLSLSAVLMVTGCHERKGITLSGTIEARDAELASRVGGRVLRVHVREGEKVKRGEPLVTLDGGPARALLAESRAGLAEASARLAELTAGTRRQEIEKGRARVAAARANAENAAARFRRGERLYREGVVSANDFDEVEAAHRTAQAELQEAMQHLALLEEGPRREEIEAAQAAVGKARAAVRRARLDLREAKLTAPWGGVIEVLDAEPGDFLAPGAPVARIADPGRLWVTAYVPENLLGWVRRGEPVLVRVDSFPRRRYRAGIEAVATEAEFTPRNIQNRADRALQVFAVKVALIDTEGLRAGMAADVLIREGGEDAGGSGG